jgi:predicted nucleotidyltransferase
MMSAKVRAKPKPRQKAAGPMPKWYRGGDVPKTAIRRFAREVAEKFRPKKIILFGSHAYGRLHADSDVDILVIMPCRNELDQAYKIRLAVEAPFPLDIKVRTPHNMSWRLKEGDWFLREVVAKGKVLYEAPDKRVGAKGGKRLSRGNENRRPKASSA